MSDPIIEEMAKKLFGMEMYPQQAQRRMISEAVQAAGMLIDNLRYMLDAAIARERLLEKEVFNLRADIARLTND